MTTQEILSSLSGSLMDDERILSARERELLSSLLQHTKNITGSRDNAVAETMARAIGEVIAQRAYGILGSNITQRLLDSSAGLGIHVRAFQNPEPRSEYVPETNPGAGGISMPQAVNLGPRAAVMQAESNVAVLDLPATLPGRCIVLDEFLAPAELEALMAYTMASEGEFQVSEVISPDLGGAVDFEYRRSRILQDLGVHRDVVLNRIQAFLPRVFEQLRGEPFPVSRIEAQITASNDGDFFRWHNDNGQGEIATREITFVYFFHREPKQFQGGELRLYDSRWDEGIYRPQETYRSIVPQQNQAILFLSSLAHEITAVECPSKAFADSRFTLNGWLHR